MHLTKQMNHNQSAGGPQVEQETPEWAKTLMADVRAIKQRLMPEYTREDYERDIATSRLLHP